MNIVSSTAEPGLRNLFVNLIAKNVTNGDLRIQNTNDVYNNYPWRDSNPQSPA